MDTIESMAMLGSAVCQRCGASSAPGVSKCPFCGAPTGTGSAEGPVDPATASAPNANLEPHPASLAARMSRGARRVETPFPAVVLGVPPRVVVGALAVLGAGGLAIALLARQAPPPAPVAPSGSSASPPPAPQRGALDPEHGDPSDLYPRAQEQALAWSRDARLVSISASPVVRDKVDLTRPDGEIVYLFVSRIDRDEARGGRFSVTVNSAGMKQISRDAAPSTATRGSPAWREQPVPEPNCVFGAAVRAARASGLAKVAELTVRYGADKVLDRGVWTVRTSKGPEQERTVDGQTCAIVTRR